MSKLQEFCAQHKRLQSHIITGLTLNDPEIVLFQCDGASQYTLLDKILVCAPSERQAAILKYSEGLTGQVANLHKIMHRHGLQVPEEIVKYSGEIQDLFGISIKPADITLQAEIAAAEAIPVAASMPVASPAGPLAASVSTRLQRFCEQNKRLQMRIASTGGPSTNHVIVAFQQAASEQCLFLDNMLTCAESRRSVVFSNYSRNLKWQSQNLLAFIDNGGVKTQDECRELISTITQIQNTISAELKELEQDNLYVPTAAPALHVESPRRIQASESNMGTIPEVPDTADMPEGRPLKRRRRNSSEQGAAAPVEPVRYKSGTAALLGAHGFMPCRENHKPTKSSPLATAVASVPSMDTGDMEWDSESPFFSNEL